VRWRLALALAYATLAAALSSSVLAPPQGPGSLPRLALDGRLVWIALVVAAAALTPLFQEGFKELLRQALARRRSWKLILLSALFQAALLVAPILLLVLVVSSRPPPPAVNGTGAPLLPAPQTAPSGAGGAEGEGSEPARTEPSRQAAAAEPAGGQWDLERLTLLAAAALLSVTAATAAYAAYEAWREARAAPEAAGERGVEPELLEAARAAVRELEEGGDPRGAIVSYFLKLCRLLRERGVAVGEEMTAREVAQLALERFRGLDPVPLARLVRLFEEARYSDHRVDEAMREEALACFRAIADGLSRGA